MEDRRSLVLAILRQEILRVLSCLQNQCVHDLGNGNNPSDTGVLRLFEWTRDFDMNQQKNTHAQVQICLMTLPHEYWMERMLQEIASAVGTLLVIDNVTFKRIYDHYARISVDMDFSNKLFYDILVKREGFSFPVEVVYEQLLNFCSHCQDLGHDVTDCR